MFDESTEINLKTDAKSTEKAPKPAPFNWKSLPVDDLVRFLDEIRAVLPPLALKEVNLEEELFLQYRSLRHLQSMVMGDEGTPVNQRAQVANATSSVLARISELQISVHSSERFKAIEALLIRSLNALPEETAEAFLKDYETILASLK